MAGPRKNTKKTARSKVPPAAQAKRPVVAAEDLPRRKLEDCVAVAKALHDTYAGNSTPWDDLANALGVGKKTAPTKYLFWASVAYGVLNKEEKNSFSLSELGRKIVAPTYAGEDSEGLLKAAMTPNVLSRFFTDYANHPLPNNDMLANVLERKYNVPRERAAEATELILANAEFTGVLSAADSEGRRHLRLTGAERTVPLPVSRETRDASAGPAVDSPDTVDWNTTCFYITPIGDDASEARRHADMMLKHVVAPAATEHGFNVVRADKISKAGIITKQVLEYLLYSRMCVADLSFNNPNVFYELGVRHLCLKACPQIIRKGDRIPFDVSQGRTIVVDTGDPYSITDRLQSACRELGEHIKQALSGENVPADDNPIHVYVPGVTVTLPRRPGGR